MMGKHESCVCFQRVDAVCGAKCGQRQAPWTRFLHRLKNVSVIEHQRDVKADRASLDSDHTAGRAERNGPHLRCLFSIRCRDSVGPPFKLSGYLREHRQAHQVMAREPHKAPAVQPNLWVTPAIQIASQKKINQRHHMYPAAGAFSELKTRRGHFVSMRSNRPAVIVAWPFSVSIPRTTR